jgi:hypothetical protein
VNNVMTQDRNPEPPADSLAQLIDSWNRLRPAEHLEKRVAEDTKGGPQNLVRIVQALELAARRTGGSLSKVTEQVGAAETAHGALHHMVELMQHGGASSAVAVARQLEIADRRQVLALLRSFWQAPTGYLVRPLHDMRTRQHNLWRA